eukprot:2708801-Prymnesium_polylepis.1
MCFCRASTDVTRTGSVAVISLAPDREGRGFEPLRGRYRRRLHGSVVVGTAAAPLEGRGDP